MTFKTRTNNSHDTHKISKRKGHLVNYRFYTKCPMLLNIIYGLKQKR